MPATSGRIRLDDKPLDNWSEVVTGRRIGYVGADTFFRNSTLRDCLLYGLMHYPLHANRPIKSTIKREALASGNSTLNLDADWVDYQRVGTTSSVDLRSGDCAARSFVYGPFDQRTLISPGQILPARSIANDSSIRHARGAELCD